MSAAVEQSCPVCGAAGGDPCTSTKGRELVSPHWLRSHSVGEQVKSATDGPALADPPQSDTTADDDAVLAVIGTYPPGRWVTSMTIRRHPACELPLSAVIRSLHRLSDLGVISRRAGERQAARYRVAAR